MIKIGVHLRELSQNWNRGSTFLDQPVYKPEIVQLRARAGNTEERIILKPGDRQLGVDSTSIGQQVRGDGPADSRQLVGRQPIQQTESIASSQLQLAARRQVYDSGLLHHHLAFTYHWLKPASSDVKHTRIYA